MFDFEIRKITLGSSKPIYSDEVEKERFKDIKSRLGKAAFIETFGPQRRVNKVYHGIKKSEGALKWIADTFKEEE